MKPFFFVFAFTLFLLAPVAAEATAPLKDSLVAHWEAMQRSAPDTIVFEATKDKGVYRFETAFFPYKGRVRLLNAAVSKLSGGAYADLYTGIIEVELMDAPGDFMRKYGMSYAAWLEQNRFYYDAKKNVWFSGGEWGDHFLAEGSAPVSGHVSYRLWFNLGLIAGLLVLILLLARFARRQQARALAAQELMMERQKRILEIAEENLGVNRAILDELKKS